MSGIRGPRKVGETKITGIVVDPLTELSQPGGPLPVGYSLQTDGLGGYFLGPQMHGCCLRDYVEGVEVLDAVTQVSSGKVRKAKRGDDTFTGLVELMDFPVKGKCVVRFSGDLQGFSDLEPGVNYFLDSKPGKLTTHQFRRPRWKRAGIASSASSLLIIV